MLHRLPDINNLPDPLKQYQFTFVISKFRGSDGIAGALTGNFKNAFKNTTKSVPERFELQCSSFSWPGARVGTTEVCIADFKRTRPTVQNKSGQWKTTVYETMDGLVITSIRNWLDAIHNPMSGINLPSTLYVSQCEVKFSTPLTEKKAILRGFYPIEMSEVSINPSSSEPVSVSVTWNYDWYTESNLGGVLNIL